MVFQDGASPNTFSHTGAVRYVNNAANWLSKFLIQKPLEPKGGIHTRNSSSCAHASKTSYCDQSTRLVVSELGTCIQEFSKLAWGHLMYLKAMLVDVLFLLTEFDRMAVLPHQKAKVHKVKHSKGKTPGRGCELMCFQGFGHETIVAY